MSWLKDKFGHFLGGQATSSNVSSLQRNSSSASRFAPYLELDYLPLARRMIEQYLVNHGSDVAVWCQLAKVRWRMRDVTAAGEALRRSLATPVSQCQDENSVLAVLSEMDADTLEKISNIVAVDQVAKNKYQKLLAIQKMPLRETPDATTENALVAAKKLLATDMATRETYLFFSRFCAQQGDLAAAATYLQNGVRVFATDTTLYHELAKLLKTHGRASEAIAVLESALINAPATELAHYQLGEHHLAARQLDDAVAEFTFALNINPLFAEAQSRLADVALTQNQFEVAVSDYCSALELGCATDGVVTGAAKLQQKDRPQDAVRIYQKLLVRGLTSDDVLSNFGLALRQLGDLEEARTQLEEALRVAPTHFGACHNYALVLGELGQVDKAIQRFSALLSLKPNDVDTQVGRALLRLLNLEFVDGWDDYEARRQRADCRRPFAFPEWDGARCDGKTLLIYGEQGLGDELMFASCVPDVLTRADHVILECDPRLAPLFARSFPLAKIQARVSLEDVAWLRDADKIDMQCPSGSLPRLFRRSIDAFPVHAGYLRADEPKTEKWRKRLAQLPGTIKVGLSWRGGADRTRRNLRSIELIQLAPLFRLADVTFVNLQYGDVAAECEAASSVFGKPIVQFAEAIADYDETAALVCALDLVVSVQTAIVHLTGALGKTALVMLPFSPEWRYMRSGDRMLWYPSVKLFRQEKVKDWDPVIARIAQELAAFSLTPRVE